MADWRDAILNEFVPEVSKLILVADPDALLIEERLALALEQWVTLFDYRYWLVMALRNGQTASR